MERFCYNMSKDIVSLVFGFLYYSFVTHYSDEMYVINTTLFVHSRVTRSLPVVTFHSPLSSLRFSWGSSAQHQGQPHKYMVLSYIISKLRACCQIYFERLIIWRVLIYCLPTPITINDNTSLSLMSDQLTLFLALCFPSSVFQWNVYSTGLIENCLVLCYINDKYSDIVSPMWNYLNFSLSQSMIFFSPT